MLLTMELSRRQLLSLGGGIAAAFALSGCGVQQPVQRSAPGTSGRITQWYHAYPDSGVENAVRGFAADYAPAKVDVIWVPADYEKTVLAALPTSAAPDVFEFATGPTIDMIRSGRVADLTGTIGAARSEFCGSVMDRLTYDGKIWAVPQAIDTQVLYYRPSLFDAAGLTAPTTFAELTAAAKRLTKGSTAGFFAGNDGGLGVFSNVLLWAAGLQQINADKTATAFNQPALYDAVVAYRSFLQSGAVLTKAARDWPDPEVFTSGGAAMYWGGLWNLPRISQQLDTDVAVLPFPAIGSQGRPVVPVSAYSACVHADSPVLDAAREYVQWLWIEQSDRQVKFADGFAVHIPARTALATQTTNVSDGVGAAIVDLVQSRGQVDDIMWTPEATTVFQSALVRAVQQGADPQTVFTTAAAAIDREIRRILS